MTPAEVNALPERVRKYIHDLKTNADPAGMVRANVLLREENAQLRALVGELMEWLPIETAPKTSRAILVFVAENMCSYAVTWRAPDDDARKEGWLVFGGDWREHIQRATHWMPLPAPPTDAAMGSEAGDG